MLATGADPGILLRRPDGEQGAQTYNWRLGTKPPQGCRDMIDNKYPILCIFARNCQQEGQRPLTGQHTANFRLSFL